MVGCVYISARLKLSVDSFWPALELSVDLSGPNLELDVDTSWFNLGWARVYSGTIQDWAQRNHNPILDWDFHVMVFKCEIFLENCRTCAAARRLSTLKEKMEYLFLANKERQGILVSTSENMDWESPPNILVTRNPNWSQRWGTETGCVKGRY